MPSSGASTGAQHPLFADTDDPTTSPREPSQGPLEAGCPAEPRRLTIAGWGVHVVFL
ncbi:MULTISPECIES: hypothetical protein [Rhodococcus]|uniref:hypothetical protein n=1 Tax=Rhodococcus TaxID=1827 RepID=UPI0004B40EEB|nr:MULTISPECIES: hypothetical protein [Rhodococcus]WAM15336.1 hypothetical protein OYT95_01275 [Rhodococcus sp. JS3073]